MVNWWLMNDHAQWLMVELRVIHQWSDIHWLSGKSISYSWFTYVFYGFYYAFLWFSPWCTWLVACFTYEKLVIYFASTPRRVRSDHDPACFGALLVLGGQSGSAPASLCQLASQHGSPQGRERENRKQRILKKQQFRNDHWWSTSFE